MKTIFSLLLLFFSTSLCLAQEKHLAEIEKHLHTLSSDDMQGRKTGTEGLNKSADYIAEYFRSEDIKPFYKSYKDTVYLKNRKTAYNIVAHIEGRDSAYQKSPVIIGAHYDHIGIKKEIDNDSIANGANDNASGTVAVMQLAKLLKNTTPLRPILFVLFDAEEQGLKGSRYLAEKLKSENIKPYVVFNIEMIGVPMKETPENAYLTGFEKSNFAEIFNSIINEGKLIFSEQSQKYNLFKRSDNYSFFRTFEIPAHSVSTFDFTNYEYYHHVDDEAQHQNIEHIYKLTSQWAEALNSIANHEEFIIKLYN